ncbi:MAG TPA: hypothetical protein PKD55_05115, partial [Bellilinea sp.]|nr:hypothetical protein [Bellilinea sp.]
MPFTPYHFGPGILLSAVSRNNVDWAAYCLANVLIDLEPLYYMAVEERPLHRTMHTFVMATVAVVGAYLLMVLAGRIWQRVFKNASPPFALPRGQLIAGAVLGGYSHIFLDAVLYR